MAHPKTKADLLIRMRAGHQKFYDVLARIPDERMHEIALYDNWSIKDFIAHIASWQQNTADRIAMLKRGERPPQINVDAINAQVLERYRDTPLDEVRAMEASSFAALEQQVKEASDAELFEPTHFPGRKSSLVSLIAGDSYDHYPEHLGDARAWMKKIGLE
jgi:hypothetical protein